MVPGSTLKILPVKEIIGNTSPQVSEKYHCFSTEMLQNETFLSKITFFMIPVTDQLFILFQHSMFQSIFRGAITPVHF